MQFSNDAGAARPSPGSAMWRKATASNPSGNCVELAALPDGDIAFRNSRHPAGPVLVCSRAELAAFLAGVRAGEFDDLVSPDGRADPR